MSVVKAAGVFGGGVNGLGKKGHKSRSYDLGNTNLCNMGSDLEKAIRQAAAETEHAWDGVGKEAGIRIWRIEQFKVMEWPAKLHGRFYSGDSYIILNTYHKKGQGALVWDIHFWIGKLSTQDEYGTAAYKTVELDDFLGGRATQYREVQNHESRKFKGLFKKLIFMDGGVETGFNHVEAEKHRNRLLHCKGRMYVVVREVPISYKSLNSGDSFIYDGGDVIYVWNGSKAAPMEKAKAANIAQALDDERGGAPHREVFDEGHGNQKEWWRALGGEGAVMSAEEGGADDDVTFGEKRLLRLSDASGRPKLDLIASNADVSRDLLTDSDVYILDDGYEVMVWVGKRASIAERKTALNFAVEYLKAHSLPLDRPISRILQGGENEQFEAAFEVGVLSTERPGEKKDVKFSANISKFGGHSKQVSSTMAGGYRGSGQGSATDFDALYAQKGADPAAWKGRSAATSSYAQELQASKTGAYSASSGWVSGMSAEERSARAARVAQLERDHKSGKYAAAGASGTAASGGRLGLPEDFSPTIFETKNFSAANDAELLRKAVKGWGTNDKLLIRVLGYRTQAERNAIRLAYSAQFERDLVKDLKHDTSGNFSQALQALAQDAARRDAQFVHKCVQGLGTDNSMLIDIICTKHSTHLARVAAAYDEMYPGSSITGAITGDTSGHYRKLLLAFFNNTRAPDDASIDPAEAASDAQRLYDAGEKRMGTDEGTFVEIFTTRSFGQLAAIFMEYAKICKYDIRESISREMSGNLKQGFQTVVDVVRDPALFYARRINHCIKGLGTSNSHLIELLIERSEVDLGNIMAIYNKEFGQSLEDALKGEMAVAWNYGRLLKAILSTEQPKDLS